MNQPIDLPPPPPPRLHAPAAVREGGEEGGPAASRVNNASAFKGAFISWCDCPYILSHRILTTHHCITATLHHCITASLPIRWLLCACAWAVILSCTQFMLQLGQWRPGCVLLPPLWIVSAIM